MANQFSSITNVFVLAAPQNSGKTTTLNLLAYEIATRFSVKSLTKEQPTNNPFTANGDSIDGHFAFQVFLRGKNVVIGISTPGDEDGAIENGFAFFDDKHCEICFLASRTWGKVFDKVKNEAKNRSAIYERIRMESTTDEIARKAEEQKKVQELFSRI